MELNTREIAILIWLGIGLAFCVLHPAIRGALKGVLHAVTQWQILLLFGVIYAYTALMLWGLAAISLWDWDQLKNVLIWSVVVGLASLFRLRSIGEDLPFFRDWVRDNLKIIVVFEFVATFYTLPLLGELILQPLLLVLFGTLAVAGTEERYLPAKRLLEGIVAFIGFGIVLYAAWSLFIDWKSFATWTTLRDFYTPILLSLGLLPLLFLLHVLLNYERVFVATGIHIKDPVLHRFAKLRATMAFGPSTALLSRWNRYIGAHRPSSKDEIVRSIRDVKAARRRERRPTKVPLENGWSPDLARRYLEISGIVARDYHRLYDEWRAASPMKEIGTDPMPDNVAYYIEGDELVADTLTLELNVNNPANPAASEAEFASLCKQLAGAALQHSPQLSTSEDFDIGIEGKRVTLSTRRWEGGIRGGYERTFTIFVPAAVEARKAAQKAEA